MPSKRDIVTSPRILELKRKRRSHRRIFFYCFVILFVGIVVGLSFLSHYHKFVITNVVVSGTHIIDSTSVQAVVTKDISGNYFHLFSKANAVLYPHAAIETDLMKTFPRIDTLSIKRDGWNTLDIIITEKVGSYLWCGNAIPTDPTAIGDNCYFLNSDGVIFDTAPYFSGNVYFRFYTNLANPNASPIGQSVLGNDPSFQNIIAFVDGLTKLGFTPVSALLVDSTNYQIGLVSKMLGDNPEIFFQKDQDFPTLLNTLSIALQKEAFATDIWTHYATLLYIDLRFKYKVIYKFSSE